MLWTAGQQRLVRERREHLADLFVAARDAAFEVGVKSGQLKAKGAWRLPSYMQTLGPRPQGSPAARDRTLAQLGVMFPGMVKRADS